MRLGMEASVHQDSIQQGKQGELTAMKTTDIDTTNMCSHLRHKLMDADGAYHRIWQAMEGDPELMAVVRSRQLHIYRNGKKVLVLKGKSSPQIVRADALCDGLGQT